MRKLQSNKDKDPKQLKEVTIYADTNNPRYKSYKDSLDLYNKSNNEIQKVKDYITNSVENHIPKVRNWKITDSEMKANFPNNKIKPTEFAYVHASRWVASPWDTIVDVYPKPTGQGIPPRNIRIQPKSVSNISTKQPTIEQRPYTPVNTKRGDKIFFQYSPGGKNNYINYGEGKGRETLTNQEADKLFNDWNEDGTMQILGETGQSNYGGKKKFAGGGITDWPPKPIDQITYTQPELAPATTKNLDNYSNSTIKLIDNKYNVKNNLNIKRGTINQINNYARLGQLNDEDKKTLYAIALNESNAGNSMKNGKPYPLFGDIDFGKDSFTSDTGNRELDRINFIKNKTKNFTNLNKYNPRHIDNFGEDYTTRINRMKEIIDSNPILLDSMGIKKLAKGGSTTDPPYTKNHPAAIVGRNYTKSYFPNVNLDEVKVGEETSDNKDARWLYYGGHYYPKADSIALFPDAFTNSQMTHEYVHAADKKLDYKPTKNVLSLLASNYIPYNQNKSLEYIASVGAYNEEHGIKPGSSTPKEVYRAGFDYNRELFPETSISNEQLRGLVQRFPYTNITKIKPISGKVTINKNGGIINPMKNTYRIGKTFNPPKRAIGGVVSSATGLYNSVNQLGQTMIDSNVDQYGLIDNKKDNATYKGLQGALDPLTATVEAFENKDYLGAALGIFAPTVGSWYTGVRNANVENDQATKDLAKIKAEEANSKRIAGLQMGKYGASTYNQYGMPGVNQYTGGGRIGKARGGPIGSNKLSKSDAYWLAVHGSKENAGKDARMWKDVYKELYVKPLNPSRIFMTEAMPGQTVNGEFTVTNKFPKTKRPFGFSLSKQGIKSLGKSASKFLNVLVPGAEDMPIIPSMMPNYNSLPNKVEMKKGGKIGDPPWYLRNEGIPFDYNSNKSINNQFKEYVKYQPSSFNPPMKHDIKLESVKDFGKIFSKAASSEKLKILAKMGMKTLNALIPGVEDLPISPLAIPGYKNTFGNTSLKCGGKVKKHMMKRAGGGMIPVKLDNKEIVYDQFGNPAPIITNSPVGIKAGGTLIKGGKGRTDGVNAMLPPNSVVISNDNGEVNKLTNEFRYSPSKQVVGKYMNRAVAKQSKFSKGLYGGGNPWDKYNAPMSMINYYNNNPYGSNPWEQSSPIMAANIGNSNIPTISNTLSNPTKSIYPYPQNKKYTWTESNDTKDMEFATGSSGFAPERFADNGMSSSGKSSSNSGGFESFIKNPDTWQAASAIGELGLGVANTVMNVRAMNKLKKLKFPDYTPGRFYEQDPRYMKGYFNTQRGEVDKSSLNTMEYLRRNTPSSSLIGSYGKINADVLSNKSKIAGQESGTIGDIMNQNSRNKTMFSMDEAQKYMGYKGAKLAHKIGLIQTGVNLNNSTINTLQGFTRNLGQNAYQEKQLAAYADANMLPKPLPGEDWDTWRKRVFKTIV